MVRKNYLVLLIILIYISIFFIKNKKNVETSNIPIVVPTIQPTRRIDEIYPIAQFEQRITKKMFGFYVTPQNSPIQPERFQGFHTGVDVEYEDTEEEIPVLAVCNGEIVLTKWIAGYGGTVVLRCQLNDVDYYVVYGHIKINSISSSPKMMEGDQIGVLGKGETQETDFERKHLHFGIHRDSIDLRGYVQSQNELERWVDPVAFMQM